MSRCITIIVFFWCITLNAFSFAQSGEVVKPVNERKIFNGLSSKDVVIKENSITYVKNNPNNFFRERLSRELISNRKYKEVYFEALKIYDPYLILDTWIDILDKTRSFELKEKIIDYLSNLVDRRLVVAFAKQLNSPFREIRLKAARALSKNRDDRIYPYVLALSQSENPVERMYALDALNVLYDERLHRILMNLLSDSNKSVRIFAIETVVSNRITQALFRIRTMAENDLDNDVKCSALAALATMSDSASQNIFIRMLGNSDRAVRYEAAKSLSILLFSAAALPISNRLTIEQDDEIKNILLDILLRLRRTDAFLGIVFILRNDSNIRLRIKAAYILGVFRNDRTLNDLIGAAQDIDYRLRTEVANSLGNFRNPRSIETLLERIRNDKVRHVRSAALYSIANINDKRSIITLYDIYSIETEPVFREMIRRVLRQLLTNHV